MRVFKFLLLLFAAMTPVAVLNGQQAVSSATLGGRVEDPTGAAVQDIEVILINVDRNQSVRARTTSDGYYRFLHVVPGNYEVKIEHPLFAPVSNTFTVAAGQALQVPVRLALKGQSESIIVSANQLMLETARSQVSEIVRPAEIDALPLNGRNYLDLHYWFPVSPARIPEHRKILPKRRPCPAPEFLFRVSATSITTLSSMDCR